MIAKQKIIYIFFIKGNTHFLSELLWLLLLQYNCFYLTTFLSPSYKFRYFIKISATVWQDIIKVEQELTFKLFTQFWDKPIRHRTLIQHNLLCDIMSFGCLLKSNIQSMFNLWFSINLMSDVESMLITIQFQPFMQPSKNIWFQLKFWHWLNVNIEIWRQIFWHYIYVCNVKMWRHVTYRNQRWVNV